MIPYVPNRERHSFRKMGCGRPAFSSCGFINPKGLTFRVQIPPFLFLSWSALVPSRLTFPFRVQTPLSAESEAKHEGTEKGDDLKADPERWL